MNKKYILLVLSSGVILLTGCTAKTNTTGYTNVGNQETVSAQRKSPSATPIETSQTEKLDQDIALSITSPLANATVTNPTIIVKGKTVPNAEVYVNDTELNADAKGDFSAPVTLDEGENTISIAVNDANGNASEEELTVTYEAQ